MIKLVKNKVAIVPLENPEMIGRIIIPDIAKTRLNQGFIKYVGPDVEDVVVGDYVLFSGFTGTLTHIEGEGKLIIMPEDFLVAHISRLPNLQVPGLYFKDKHGNFFEANYENAMDYLMLAFSEDKDWRNRYNIKSMEKPILEDYDKMRVKT